MAVGTPFHSRTEPLCTSLRWKQWSGYLGAVVYDDFHDPEYHAIRTGAGLIDVSPLYKYDIQGPDAARLVDRLITRDASKCHVGQVLYAAWCDEGGKVIQYGCFQRLPQRPFSPTGPPPPRDPHRIDGDPRLRDLGGRGPSGKAVGCGSPRGRGPGARARGHGR